MYRVAGMWGHLGAGRMQNSVLEDDDGDRGHWVRSSPAQKFVILPGGVKPGKVDPSFQGSGDRSCCSLCLPRPLSKCNYEDFEEGVSC